MDRGGAMWCTEMVTSKRQDALGISIYNTTSTTYIYTYPHTYISGFVELKLFENRDPVVSCEIWRKSAVFHVHHPFWVMYKKCQNH